VASVHARSPRESMLLWRSRPRVRRDARTLARGAGSRSSGDRQRLCPVVFLPLFLPLFHVHFFALVLAC
jgi:hypothetical protein